MNESRIGKEEKSELELQQGERRIGTLEYMLGLEGTGLQQERLGRKCLQHLGFFADLALNQSTYIFLKEKKEYIVITLKILDLELTLLWSQEHFATYKSLIFFLHFFFNFKITSQLYPKEPQISIIMFTKLERVGTHLCIIQVGLHLEDVFHRIYLLVTPFYNDLTTTIYYLNA